MQVWYLDQEDPLEEVMATHSSILAWRILIDRGAWCATVHRVIKSGTWLKVTWHTCTPYICVVLHYKKLISFWQSLRRKYIKIYTEINISRVAQRIKNLPAVQETGFDPCVRKIPWRRKWKPTSIFLPRELHGQRSLVGYSPWDCNKLDMTEWLTHTLYRKQINNEVLLYTTENYIQYLVI